jgi:hypothetical protein
VVLRLLQVLHSLLTLLYLVVVVVEVQLQLQLLRRQVQLVVFTVPVEEVEAPR